MINLCSHQKYASFLRFAVLVIFTVTSQFSFAQTMYQINASDTNIQYTGRINRVDSTDYIFAYSGVSIFAKFQGTAIDAVLTEYGSGTATTTNYFNVIIDGGTPIVIKLSSSQTVYQLARGLIDGIHTIELFKRTESNVGRVAFKGFQLEQGKKLLQPDPLPTRKIEFIGNSITCGYGNELSTTDPNSYHFTSVNENNYKAWGAVTARNLNAQYSCVAYSGRGLYRNNTGSTTGVAPQFYDQTFADDNTVLWDHTTYVPDVIVINLGTNDFSAEVASSSYAVDSTTFCTAYVNFITKLRGYYPNVKIFLTVGVMMSDNYPVGTKAWTRIQNYVSSVKKYENKNGDANVFYYMMAPQTGPNYGEDWHPTAAEDVLMATGVTNYIKSITKWTSCGSVNLGNDVSTNTTTFPLTLNSQSVAKVGVTYSWYKNDTLIQNATSATYQIDALTNALGTYEVVRDSADCSLTDQMIITNSYLSTGKIANWDNNKKAAVVLTFDDWMKSDYPIDVPELKARNLVGTFNVITGNVDAWSDWTNVNNTAVNGNEIADHTVDHVDLTASSTKLAYEVDSARTDIDRHVTSQKVSTLAYPMGTYNAAVIKYLESKGFVGARGVFSSSGNYSYNFAPTIDAYYEILTTIIGSSETSAVFASQVQNVIGGGGLLTFTYHSVYSATVNDQVYSPIPQFTFEAQLDTLVTYRNKVWITTFAQALKYHREATCASLLEIQAPNNSQWTVNLTDTLTNNTTFNQPLTVQLKMNGVKYDNVYQNGKVLRIDSTFNDTIMFHAVPNAGNIHLSCSGINMNVSASPLSFVNTKATAITFTATATGTTTINNVSIDLSAIGGGDTIIMNSTGSNTFKYTDTVASGFPMGIKNVYFTATDDSGKTHVSKLLVTINDGITISSAKVSPNSATIPTSDTLTFTVKATDDVSIAGVALDLSSIGGGTAVAMTSVGANVYTSTYIVPSTGITSGLRSIPVAVTDNLGNTTQTKIPVTVVYAPSVFVVNSSVTPNVIFNNSLDTVVFQVNVTDNYSITSVTVDLSSIGGSSSASMTNIGSNNYTCNYVYPITTSTGTKTVAVTITDSQSHKKNINLSFKVNAAPVVFTIDTAFVTPSVIANNGSDTLKFLISATDNYPITSVTIDLSTIGGNSSAAMTKSAGSNNYTLDYVYPVDTLTGIKTVVATVTDILYNSKQSNISFLVNAGVKSEIKFVSNNNAIKIYPNPSSGKILIDSQNTVIENMSVFDVFGKLLLNDKTKTSSIRQVNFSEYPRGVYFISIQTPTDILKEKIVIN